MSRSAGLAVSTTSPDPAIARRVAAASSAVLGRQESKLVERRATEPAAQEEEFTKAIREAAALRDGIKESGPERKLVAFVMEEKAIPRAGMEIRGGGEVTSGTHSPMLDQGIGMGYTPTATAKPGTELVIDVRGRDRRATVVPKPIYKREE